MPTEPARRDNASLARGLAGRRVPFTSVPVIDIAPLLDGTNKAAVARKIARGAREVGFFYVRNHGISDAQTGAVFAAARRFFALAQEAKDALHVAKSYPAQRGYIPFYAENTDPEVTADLKECFDVALEHAPDDPPVPGTFVVNLGELTERWTNGLYPATLHRVINAGGRDRYSMPFFLDTNYDARIECIETCQDATRPPKFPPVLGGEYLFKRYDETFAFRRHLTDPL